MIFIQIPLYMDCQFGIYFNLNTHVVFQCLLHVILINLYCLILNVIILQTTIHVTQEIYVQNICTNKVTVVIKKYKGNIGYITKWADFKIQKISLYLAFLLLHFSISV